MSTPLPAAAPFASSTRILAGALMGALVMIGVALGAVVPLDAPVSPVVLGAQVAAGVVVHLLLEAIGYRTAPLSTALPDEQAAAQARTRWQTLMVMRFAIAESIAIASIAATFVLTDAGFVTYLGGAVVSLALMALHVWPGARPVGKVADALEADGRRSGLREVFGHSSPGPVQRL